MTSLPTKDNISILQINLRKSSTANHTAITYAILNKIDIILIQDPHISNNNLTFLPSSFSVYFSSFFTAGIVVMNTNLIHIMTKSFENSVFVNFTFEDKNVIIGSQYTAPSKDLDTDLKQWTDYFTSTDNLLIGGDFNSHLHSWGLST